MRKILSWFARAVLCAALIGCGSQATQPAFPDLHPVKGIVKQGGQPVKGGAVQFTTDPLTTDFLLSASVGNDGTFALTTVRATDTKGERKTGAPAGNYKVTYTPLMGDQTAGPVTGPVELPNPVTVTAGNNDLMLEVPKK